jgi:hypothetical protein
MHNSHILLAACVQAQKALAKGDDAGNILHCTLLLVFIFFIIFDIIIFIFFAAHSYYFFIHTIYPHHVLTVYLPFPRSLFFFLILSL